MPTHITLLRGINVGGNKIIRMADLKALFEALGHSQVRTYIQSGNVVYLSATEDTAAVSAQIAQKIAEVYGFKVSVVTLSVEEYALIVSHNPYTQKPEIEADKLHVTFLDQVPEAERTEATRNGEYGNDSFEVIGKAVYVHCPDGYGKTLLENGFFEKKLKVTASTRNWKTTQELLKMAQGI